MYITLKNITLHWREVFFYYTVGLMSSPKLSIIIPAYNEENRLPSTLDRLFHYMREHFDAPYEVIVANDGSRDRTAEMVRELMKSHPELRLMDFSKNRGRGAVVRDAMFSAAGAYILQTDADGSVGEEAVVRFVKYLDARPEVDMLIGSRLAPGAKTLTPQPFLRVFLGYAFIVLAMIMFRWKFEDRVNGFKMFRRDGARDIYRNQYSDHYIAEAEVVYVAERRGWKVQELPIFWTDFRDSKIKPIRDSYRSFKGMMIILFNDWKGRYSKDMPVTKI